MAGSIENKKHSFSEEIRFLLYIGHNVVPSVCVCVCVCVCVRVTELINKMNGNIASLRQTMMI